MKRIAVVLILLLLSATVWADSVWVGTWVQRATGQGMTLTMTVEEAGGGWKLTYKLTWPNTPPMAITFATQLDGKDSPTMVDGRPTGQTMAVRKIDRRHYVGVLKFEGKETGTSKGEVSPDGKVLKVENDNTVDSPNGPAGRSTQYWDKK
jgi:hypothetical protein